MGNTNPITLKEGYSSTYKKIHGSENFKRLPAIQPSVKKELFTLLDQTNIIILTGDTGSGKTTIVPSLVWEYMDYVESVVCTQPRTLTAKSVAEFVSKILDVQLGRHVGFKFRGSDRYKGGDISGIGVHSTLTYMTEGTFLNDTLKNPSKMAYYGAVMVDEAHDRTLDCDFILFFIKHLLETNTNLQTKFIIMSATIDKDIFLNYFRAFNPKHMHIPGRTFPVEAKFLKRSLINPQNLPLDQLKVNSRQLKNDVNNYINMIVSDILKNPNKRVGDILAFLPSNSHIAQAALVLEKSLQQQNFKNYKIIKVSRDFQDKMTDKELEQITTPIPGITKIVLSTNIAETGITINGVYYVIESGLAYHKGYDYSERLEVLDLNYISQAASKQRRGRAGRMQSGVCFHLYTQQEFNNFPKFREAQLFRDNFDIYLLKLINLFKNTPDGFNMVRDTIKQLVEQPKLKDYRASLNFLETIKAYELKGQRSNHPEYVLSDLGDCLLNLDLDTLDLAYLYLTGYAYEIEEEVWNDIMAILQVSTSFSKWFYGDLPPDFKSKYQNDHGDLFAIYHIYLDWKNKEIPEDYINSHLNTPNFEKVSMISDALSQNKAMNTSYFCHEQIQPKKRIPTTNLYRKIILAFQQALPASNQIHSKEIKDKLDFYKNNFIDLKKPRKLLALSKIRLSTFQSGGSAYDNFLVI